MAPREESVYGGSRRRAAGQRGGVVNGSDGRNGRRATGGVSVAFEEVVETVYLVKPRSLTKISGTEFKNVSTLGESEFATARRAGFPCLRCEKRQTGVDEASYRSCIKISSDEMKFLGVEGFNEASESIHRVPSASRE
jgi:hypothetical protein